MINKSIWMRYVVLNAAELPFNFFCMYNHVIHSLFFPCSVISVSLYVRFCSFHCLDPCNPMAVLNEIQLSVYWICSHVCPVGCVFSVWGLGKGQQLPTVKKKNSPCYGMLRIGPQILLNIRTGNKLFEHAAELKYLGMRVTNWSCVYEEIKSILNSRNASCHSF